MTEYFFDIDNNLCHMHTLYGIIYVTNIDTTSMVKIRNNFYIDNEGNLFRIIYCANNNFTSVKIHTDHKFIDILKFCG